MDNDSGEKERRTKKGEAGNELSPFTRPTFRISILKVIVELYSFYGMFIIIDAVIQILVDLQRLVFALLLL